MPMKKDKIQTETQLGKQKDKQNSLIRNLIFYLIIAGFTWLLYGNTIYNFYNFDDYRVIENNAQAAKGIKGIPDILLHYTQMKVA